MNPQEEKGGPAGRSTAPSERRRAAVLTMAGLLAVAVIGLLDQVTGYDFSFALFYLVPIMAVSFYGGRGGGILLACLSALSWYLADYYAGHVYAHPLAIYWNSLVRLAIFLLVALMLARLRAMLALGKAQRAKLTELNSEKNRFVGMVAHDLRTPLAVIHMYADLIRAAQGGNPDARTMQFLDTISRQSDFSLKMVDNLLDLSAIESGKVALKCAPLDYPAFLESHLEHLRFLAERKGIRIELKAGKVPQVSCDRDRMGQVLDNLVMNAVKFSPPGSAIEVSVERIADGVMTLVTDAGPGIPPDELPHVFTAFRKTSVRPVNGEKGTGLGLAIARKIVEAHGGEIGVRSEPGKGSTFHFTLCGCGPAEGPPAQAGERVSA